MKKIVVLATAAAVLGWSGCSSVAPSTTAKSAGVGTLAGAGVGAVVGNNSGIGSTAGIAGGALLGAVTGGIIGMVQEAKDRKEQDRLSQERAFQQDRAKKLMEESKAKAAQEEELNIAKGFRISELELNDAQRKADESADRLKKLKDERAAALARTKSLDDLHEKALSNEAEAARLAEEIARLKGDDISKNPPSTTSGTASTSAPGSATPAATKPGI